MTIPSYVPLSEVERRVLSAIQITMDEMRIEKETYEEIRSAVGLCNQEAVGNAFYRILCGDHSDAVGRPSFLSDVI